MLQTADRKLIFTQALGIVYGRTEGEKSAENYRGQLRFDYGLDGAMYLFALAGWDRNVFGGITRRFEETAGVAWKPVRLPQNELTVEVGLSLFQQRNTVDANGGLEDNFIAGRAAALYRQSLTSTAFLTQSVEFIPNFDRSTDWRLNTESAVVAPISTAIGVKLSYVIRYDNLPGLKPDPNPNQERLEKTDRFFSAGLTIAY
jgi:putative salt-induced outer membrane protein